MSLRNIVTSVAGAIGSVWIGFQTTQNKLTWQDAFLGIPMIVTSFATGSKDDRMKLMQQQLDRLGLTEGDKKAAAGMVQIGLNQLAHRVGLQVLPYDSDGDVGLNAGTLERIADGGDYVDRGPRPDRLPSVSSPEVISEAWRQADIARGRSPIEGTNVYPSQYIRDSLAGDANDNSYSMPVQGGDEWQN
jgi:hypothetical protein